MCVPESVCMYVCISVSVYVCVSECICECVCKNMCSAVESSDMEIYFDNSRKPENDQVAGRMCGKQKM